MSTGKTSGCTSLNTSNEEMNKEESYESLSHRLVLACEWSHRLLRRHGYLAVRPRYYATGAARRAGALDRPTCWSVGSSLRDQRATASRRRTLHGTQRMELADRLDCGRVDQSGASGPPWDSPP